MAIPLFERTAIILIIILVSISCALSQVGTIRTRVDLVLVPVSVRDSQGKLVLDLNIEDFDLREDGKPQKLTSAAIDTMPPAVEVIRDNGMFQDVFAEMAQSLETFISAFREPDPQGIDGRALRDVNDAFYATASYLEQRAPDRRKIIVAAVTAPPSTDPAALRSTQVLNHLLESEVQVSFILVGHFFPFAPTGRLHAYADPTGGEVYRAANDREMKQVLSDITDLLHHQYLLSYSSNNRVAGSSPVFRKIEVKVRRSALKVTYRQKYLQFP